MQPGWLVVTIWPIWRRVLGRYGHSLQSTYRLLSRPTLGSLRLDLYQTVVTTSAFQQDLQPQFEISVEVPSESALVFDFAFREGPGSRRTVHAFPCWVSWFKVSLLVPACLVEPHGRPHLILHNNVLYDR